MSMSAKDAKGMYAQLRQIPAERWSKWKPEALAKVIRLKDHAKPGDSASMIKTLGKIAHATTEDEFVIAVCDGQLPPVKLTAGELKQLSGGGEIVHFIAMCLYAMRSDKTWDDAVAEHNAMHK